MTVTKGSQTSCMWAHLQIASHTMPGQQCNQPLRLHWIKGACMFRCNLPPALLAEWPRSFMCCCGNTEMERTLNKSRHTKLNLEKKILPPLLPGIELATFWSWVWRSYQQAIPTPISVTLFSMLNSGSIDYRWLHDNEKYKQSVAAILNSCSTGPKFQCFAWSFVKIFWFAFRFVEFFQ